MKKLSLILLALPLLLMSCSDDDDKVDYSSAIIGTWTAEAISDVTIETTPSQIGKILEESILNTTNLALLGMNVEVTIKEDKTFVEKGTDQDGTTYNSEGTYEVDGDKLTLKYKTSTLLGSETTGVSTISITGNTMLETSDITQMLTSLDEYKTMVAELKKQGVDLATKRATITLKLIKK